MFYVFGAVKLSDEELSFEILDTLFCMSAVLLLNINSNEL